jgi:hypothetical protein
MDCVVNRTLIGILSHRFSVRGRKPSSSANEISIPDRDWQHLRCWVSLPSIRNYTVFGELNYKWSSYAELKIFMLNWLWWRKPSRTGNEIRCNLYFSPSSATVSTWRQQPPFCKSKFTWRTNCMEYEQLELFDLRVYTSKEVPIPDVSMPLAIKAKQIVRVSNCGEYQQLELDLFPQNAYEVVESIALAA